MMRSDLLYFYCLMDILEWNMVIREQLSLSPFSRQSWKKQTLRTEGDIR